LRRLRHLLGNVNQPMDDLSALEDTRTAGSCEWLTFKQEFEQWRHASPEVALVLWLSGNAGSGKSVLASHIINHLEGQNLQCSFFFFKHSTPATSAVSNCLRSLAYQMSLSSPEVRKKLLALEADGLMLDEKNEKAIWRKIFLGGIFQVRLSQPQYWVIDALDECTRFQTLLSMISLLEASMGIHIFITSRKTQDIERGFSDMGRTVKNIEVRLIDTVEDIKLLITSRMDRLPVANHEDQQNLIEKILSKSAGSFLWAKLVLRELEYAWSKEAVEKVLNDIPSDMNELYVRILENMSKDRASLQLAKTILTWTTCAARPLTTSELQHVLQLDINETVYDVEKSIASMCGQLVFVDQESRVQIIHQTAQDFILQKDTSPDFAIRKEVGDFRLAMICLGFLSGGNFKAPKSRKTKPNTKDIPNKEATFLEYACFHFSDHLYGASSAEAALIDPLYQFLSSNVLSWIEYIANKGDLYHVTRSAMNIKAYLDSRSKYFPPIGYQLKTFEGWVVDLIRVSAKFRTSLLSSPSSIHWLVPPMCPKDSIIAKKFTSPHRGLSIKGLQETTWSDRLAQFDYHGSQATAIICGDRYLAVGLSTGPVILYHNVSCQLYRTLSHNERVKVLAFSNGDKLLASSSLRVVRVFDVNNGCEIHCYHTTHQSLDLTFTNESDYLMSATQGNYVMSWGLQEGCEDAQIPWHTRHQETSTILGDRQPASIAVFSSDQNFVGVCCRGQPILVFDIESEIFFGQCIRDPDSRSQGAYSHCPVVSLTFNQNSDVRLIVAAYHDGELVVYDLWTLGLRQRLSGVNAHTIVCSPDGRTLVTGSSFGTIQIFDFAGDQRNNLNLIYRINAYEEGIRSLAFSKDSLRFIDIRGSQCRIWEPAVLVRKDIYGGSQSEITDPTPIEPSTVGMKEGELPAQITAIECHGNGDIVFCGRQDGSVTVVSTHDAVEQTMLYSHVVNMAVNCIIWGAKESILATADESGRIIMRKVHKTQQQWSAFETLVDERFTGPVIGLLFDESNTRLLVSGRDMDELWALDGQKIYSGRFNPEEPRRAISHPVQPGVFIVFGPSLARIYSWLDHTEVTQSGGIKMIRATIPVITNPLATISYKGDIILTEFTSTTGNRSTSKLEFWQTSSICPDAESMIALPGFAALGPEIQHLIAVTGTKLLFLNKDLWVCSVDLRTFAKTQQASRHFFIPPDWRHNREDFLFLFTAKKEFVFAKRHELVVIKRGLDFSETVSFAKEQKLLTDHFLNVPLAV
jgi:WD40 repeat protein